MTLSSHSSAPLSSRAKSRGGTRSSASFILRSFRLLFKYQPAKYILLLLQTLFLGLTQGISIVLLIPLLQLLEVSEAESSNRLAKFIERITTAAGISLTLELVLFSFALVLTLTAFLTYYKSIYQAAYQQGFIYHIRKRLFKKIILSDWQLLNSTSRMNHLQVLTEETPKLADYYYHFIRVINTLIVGSIFLLFAFMMSVKYSLFVLVAGLVSFFILRRFLRKSYQYGNQYVEAYNRLLKYIDDFWQTVKIAKVHHSEQFYYKKFDEANSSILDLDYKLIKNYALPQLIYRITGMLVLVAVIYAGHKVEQVPLVSFFILIILFARIFPLFVSINSDANEIVSLIAPVKMVMDLDDQLPEKSFGDQGGGMIERLETGIRLEGVSFSYPGGNDLFKGLNALIPAGKLSGIIGVSGSGKTTLIDLIAGLQKPKQGQIYIDDQFLDEKLLEVWKNSIGYLPQDAFFIDGSIRENLVWDSESIADKDIWEALERVNAKELVSNQKEKLDTQVVNHQYFFSGGERQRLALARILLRKPKILILDEATSSLDEENEQVIMKVLQSLKGKVTILFVTHRSSILPYCDEVLQIPDGINSKS